MASIIRDQRRGTWSVQWNNGDRWIRKVVVRRLPGWRQGDPMPEEPPLAVTEALTLSRLREKEVRRERDFVSARSIAELFTPTLPAADQRGPELRARQSKRTYRSFKTYCALNGIEHLDQITLGVWSQWLNQVSRTCEKVAGSL